MAPQMHIWKRTRKLACQNWWEILICRLLISCDIQLAGLADGLTYLHKIPIVHKDIRGVSSVVELLLSDLYYLQSNILVSADGEACISDFGLSYRVGAITAPSCLNSSFRWNAPELHYPEIFELDECDALQPPSDVWSFGMTVLVIFIHPALLFVILTASQELISRDFPFQEISHDSMVCLAILGRKIPKRPACWPKDDLHQGLWDICLQCWVFHPALRLSMDQISKALRIILNGNDHPNSVSFPKFP
jgi:serine/threonine protein kinase